MGKTVKIGPTFSQILLSEVDKNSLFERQYLRADSFRLATVDTGGKSSLSISFLFS
jgi:hypothetical protein